jgi:hypothetical protein
MRWSGIICESSFVIVPIDRGLKGRTICDIFSNTCCERPIQQLITTHFAVDHLLIVLAELIHFKIMGALVCYE